MSEAKARNASPAKGRKTTKTKGRIAPAVARAKRRPVSGPSKDLKEARAQQAATAEILKVIASSPSDVQPVFEAIAASAKRLTGGFSTAVSRVVDGIIHLAAFTPVDPEADPVLKSAFPMSTAVFPPFELVAQGEPMQIADTEVIPDKRLKQISRARGYRSMLYVPLMRNQEAIGIIGVTRVEPGHFADHHVQLLQTFADQAVIAIENVRLFNETKEALERQTATAEILRVIATSPSDVQPVFKAIAERSKRLVNALSTTVFRLSDDVMHLEAFTPTNSEADAALQAMFPARLSTFSWAESVRRAEVFRVADTEDELDTLRDVARLRGFRSMLLVPLVRDGTPIGLISVTRVEPGPFASHHVDMLQTFADQALIAIENVRLFDEVQTRTNDLSESLQQQTAVGDVLKTISRSTFDLQPVLDTLVHTAARLCDAEMAFIMRREADLYRAGAAVGYSEEFIEFLKAHPLTVNRGNISGRAVLEQRTIHVLDLATDPEYTLREATTLAGVHTALCVPLLRENEPIGTIVVARQRVEPFTQKQIDLVTTFADQAVIAIENVRLFNETGEALERQTATADILKVIASSPSDLQPVFEAIAERSNRLIGGLSTAVYNIVNDIMHLMAFTRTSPEADAALQASFPRPLSEAPWGNRFRQGEIVEIPDAEIEWAEDPALREVVRLRGFRSVLFVPLLRDGATIGIIAVTRSETGTFAPHHVQLLQTFADQAVIAIGNVRLFDEVQARTRDLTESLQQQTATADVLKVISRSAFDLQTVLHTLAESAVLLCEAYDSVINLRHGEFLRVSAHYGPIPLDLTEWPIGRGWITGRAFIERTPVHIHDLQVAAQEFPDGSRAALRLGHRTVLAVPLLRQDEAIGVLQIRRTEVKPFTDKQIELVTTFADQAVIAIENVRLFQEVQARTRDLTESLEQQTATSEVLEVISSSAGELAPVFDKMLENATRICSANFGTMNLYAEGGFRTVALYNAPEAYASTQLHKVINPHPQSGLGTIERTHQTFHIDDIRLQPPYIEGNPNVRALADLAGARTLVIVPMLKEDELIGAITIFRQEVRPFTEKQTELVTNFANQAVIAIENARLLNELRERTTELSQSLDELRTAQDRLVQTEKLASLGQLTAGIAHEIKNPLNFVNNFAALSAELTEELNDALKPAGIGDVLRAEVNELTGLLKDNLEKVVQHGKRADSIVKNMLLHSREGSGEHRAADINSLLDESLNLAYHGARAEKGEFNITLQRDFDADAGTIELFPQEITRAFLNLIANGVYAATRRKTEHKEPGFEPTLRATTKNLGASVEIRIRDNGAGIPAGVKEKMFNPFFTTKPAGEGTGLGLSMTHDIIVKQHGGKIDVATEPGIFTEFIVTLPRATIPSKTAGGTN